MFKGLKSKLEDEAKKISSAVSQYGENVAQQLRASEGGGGILNFNKGNNENDTSKVKKNDTAVIQEYDETSLFSLSPVDEPPSNNRVRRLSDSSNISTNNEIFSFDNLIPQKSAILTELESNADESVVGSDMFTSASKEQISSIINKLNSRSAKYKTKYKNLVNTYNELVTANAKCQSVLEQTQDATVKKIKQLKDEKLILEEKLRNVHCGAMPNDVAKIKKLEELLEKCKENICNNKAKIATLNKENEELKIKLNDSHEILNNDKDDMTRQSLRKEHAEKMKKMEEDNTLALAKVKSQFHTQLEEKDNEINSWRTKYSQQVQDTETLKVKNDELVKLTEVLEQEKKEMVEKLMEAKKQVFESLENDEKIKREQRELEFNERLNSTIMENDLKWQKKIDELKEEYENSINNLHNGTHNIDTSKSFVDENNERVIEDLQSENNILKKEIKNVMSSNEKEINELKKSIEFTTERHKDEIDNIIKEAEEGTKDLKKELENITNKYNQLSMVVEDEKCKLYEKIKQLEEESSVNNITITELRKISDTQKNDLSTELNKLKVQLEVITKERDNLMIKIKEYEIKLKDLENKYQSEVEENQSLAIKLEEITLEQNTLKESTKNEIEELNMLIESKKQEILNLLNEKEAYEAELTDARLVKKLKTQLEADLEDMRNELKETNDNLLLSEERHTEMANKLKVENQRLKEEKNLWVKNEENNEELKNVLLQQSANVTSSYEKNIEELNKKLNIANEVINNLKTQITEYKNKEDNIKILESERETLEEQINVLQNELDESKENDKKIEELMIKISQMESEKADLVSKLEASSNDIEVNLNSIKQENSDLKLQLSDLQSKYENKINDKNVVVKNLEEKIIEKENEINSLREEIQNCSNKENDKLNKEMEDLKISNDNLREEYMQKESLVSELREELERIKMEKDSLGKEIDILSKSKQEYLTHIEDSTNKVNELIKSVTKLKDMEIGYKEHINILQEEVTRKNEEQETFSNEKDSLLSEIDNLKRQIKENEIALSLTEKCKKEMDEFKKEAEIKVEEMQRKISQVESDSHSKYQIELEKLKTTLENKMEDIDTLKFKKMELEDLYNEASGKVKEYSEKIQNLEDKLKETNEISMKLIEKEDAVQEIQIQRDNLERDFVEFKERSAITIAALETKITEMEEAKVIDVKKAMAKVDGDQKRMIKELQKEVKQLYQELNKTSSLNDSLNEEIKKLKQIDNNSEGGITKTVTSNVFSDFGSGDDGKIVRRNFDAIDYEELNVLREKVLNYHSKIISLEEKYDKDTSFLKDEIKRLNLSISTENNTLANALEIKSINHSIKKSPNHQYISAENYTFAEPTEAEYLRNILYRYMYERETLGKDNVTLAKVIATVAKFTPQQMEAVLNKEEARHLSWIQGTLLSGTTSITQK
uniref:GRIP domain-containing protein n=1 Tax=Parastrongyloides trichosuri TaxID=131310 RepID=A0A0N4Z2R9_PARTI